MYPFSPRTLLRFTPLTTFILYSTFNYGPHILHYITQYLSFNWKFVPFDHLHPIPLPPPPQLPPLVIPNLICFSISLFNEGRACLCRTHHEPGTRQAHCLEYYLLLGIFAASEPAKIHPGKC